MCIPEHNPRSTDADTTTDVAHGPRPTDPDMDTDTNTQMSWGLGTYLVYKEVGARLLPPSDKCPQTPCISLHGNQ